jgi:hypothetical protein
VIELVFSLSRDIEMAEATRIRAVSVPLMMQNGDGLLLK